MRPTVPAVTDELYDQLQVAAPGDDTRGWPLLIFLGGIGHAFGELHDLVRDTPDGPGWSALLDPDRCPAWALPWLAQLAGVTLTPGVAEEDWRAEITAPPAFERGTPAAMSAATARTLTGRQLVRLIERTSSPYTLTLITRTSETPDATVTLTAALSQKPAGLVLTHIVSDSPIVDEGTRTIDAATATINTAALADVT